ncbi:MAG: MFS transporter, partial [Oscillospiraceae bacterium]|nr:MFS transporter [Oscillospiraceae bacterium]
MENPNAKASIFDKLPPTLIKKSSVTLFPEGAIGYLVGPTLALLANSVLGNYFNKYMSDVLHINTWAKGFFTWLPVISVIFVVLGNV